MDDKCALCKDDNVEINYLDNAICSKCWEKHSNKGDYIKKKLGIEVENVMEAPFQAREVTLMSKYGPSLQIQKRYKYLNKEPIIPVPEVALKQLPHVDEKELWKQHKQELLKKKEVIKQRTRKVLMTCSRCKKSYKTVSFTSRKFVIKPCDKCNVKCKQEVEELK